MKYFTKDTGESLTKRIAIVVPEYRTDVAPGGGVSTVADFVISSMSEVQNWELEIFSPRMWSKANESQRIRSPKSWLKGPQTRFGSVNGKKVTYIGSHFAEFEQFRFQSRRLLRELLSSFDLIVVIAGTPASFELVRGVRVPVLAQVATTLEAERARLVDDGGIMNRTVKRLNLFFSSRFDRSGVHIPNLILVENEWMKEWCNSQGYLNSRIEFPGVDTKFFSPMENKKIDSKSNYIVSVGRLSDPRKDFGLLVRAYDIAIKNHQITQNLVIAGRGDIPLDVQQTIRSLGLETRIEIRRDVTPSELRDIYRQADFFAMSSSEEGLGIVLLEALSTGLPTISTATEGAKSVAGVAGVGRIVEFGDDLDLRFADGIAQLANDRDARAVEGIQAQQAALEHFSLVKTGAQFNEAAASLIH